MSANFEDIKDVIWEALTERFVDGTVGVFIFEDQAALRPSQGIYSTIKIINGPQADGLDEERTKDVDGELNIETLSQSALTVSLQCFRAGASSALAAVRAGARTRSFSERLKALSKLKGFELVLVDVLGMQDLSSLLQSEYEERAQVDISLRLVESTVDVAGSIDQVTAEGSIYDIDETLAATISIDVEKP